LKQNASASTPPERPIVLLHGCGGSFAATFEATGWIDAIASRGRTAVRIHLPGHGVIPAPRDPAHYSDLAGLVMRELPAQPFDAVGFSLGAKLMLEIALRLPERVGRLVLGGIGDNVFAPEAVAETVAHALESGPDPATPPGVLQFLTTWEPDRNDALGVAAVLRRPPNPQFTSERLERITQPVLIVNGADDPVTRLGGRLEACLRNVAVISLPGVDHLGLPAHPEFRRLALEFLATAALPSQAKERVS
jgi:pimeloyl-ACP methyl ester carboxylesterase